jgi:hypothetical protein
MSVQINALQIQRNAPPQDPNGEVQGDELAGV